MNTSLSWEIVEHIEGTDIVAHMKPAKDIEDITG